MQEKICAGLGMLGGMLAVALGGWDTGLRVLLCLMAADFCTGLVNAAVFHRSPKTGDGRLDSRRCFQGVCRKAEMLVFVGAAHAMDLLLESTFLRSAVLIGFCASEVISLTENAGCIDVYKRQCALFDQGLYDDLCAFQIHVTFTFYF